MKNLLFQFGYFFVLTAFVVSFSACEKDDDEDALENDKKEAIKHYADIVFASYQDSYDAAVVLKQKIDAFVAAPTAQGFEEAKNAWKAARIPYGQTEAYRFYGGPIDDEDGPEGLINAWPMDENFIDYVEGNPTAGLINNPTQYPTISKQVLESLNESISETSIFTGYHAIEFLLWGQDLSTGNAGTRPYTDYLTTGGTAANQARRGQYLKVVAELLLDHLAQVLDEWKPGGTYRKEFVDGTETAETLGKIFTALGELSKGELSGERMFVAVDSRDQENEHSCFSDNTHIDIEMNFIGIRNVYTGEYRRTNGTIIKGRSFAEIAQKVDKTKADAVTAAFTDAEQKLKQIPIPFDQAILNSADKVLVAVESLSDLSDRLTDVGFAIGAKF